MLFVTCGLALQRLSAAQPYVPDSERPLPTRRPLLRQSAGSVSARYCLAIGRYYWRLGPLRRLRALQRAGRLRQFPAVYGGKEPPRPIILPELSRASAMRSASMAVGVDPECCRWFRAFRAGYRDLLRRNRTGDRRRRCFTAIVESGGVDRAFLWTAGVLSAALVVFFARSDPPPALARPPKRARREAVKRPQTARLRWMLLLARFAGQRIGATGFNATHDALCVNAGRRRAPRRRSRYCGLALMSQCVCGALCDKLGGYRANPILLFTALSSAARCACWRLLRR